MSFNESLGFLFLLLIMFWAYKIVTVLVCVHQSKNMFVSVCLGFLFDFYVRDFAWKMVNSKIQKAPIKMPIQKSTFSFQSARQMGEFQRLKAFQ